MGTEPTFHPVTQDRFADMDSDQRGNCLPACLASLLGIPLDGIPHFVQIAHDTGVYHGTLRDDWLAERGFLILDVPERLIPPGSLYMASGPSPRDPERVTHLVIYRDGELFHDPHPDRTGLADGVVNATYVLARFYSPALAAACSPKEGTQR